MLRQMNREDRTKRIMDIFKQLKDMNLGILQFDEFERFRKASNDYVKYGVHANGKIPILGSKRVVVYSFGERVTCMLQYDVDV